MAATEGPGLRLADPAYQEWKNDDCSESAEDVDDGDEHAAGHLVPIEDVLCRIISQENYEEDQTG